MEITKDEAYQIDKEIRKLKKMVEASGLVMGKLLYEINEKALYHQLGYSTFEEYIADPEIAFSRATAYNLKKIYKQWMVDYGYELEELEDIGYERLLEAGKVATKENKEEWLHKAKTLSRSDLLLEVRELKSNENQKTFVPVPRLTRCPVCNKWKIADNDLLCKC
jgi:hypothetical protein